MECGVQINYWLEMLQRELNLSLSDSNKRTLRAACKLYNCGQKKFRCGAEIPLMGADFMDLSVRLSMDIFQEPASLANKLPEKLQRQLVEYTEALKQNYYDLTRWHIWLELDTSKGIVEEVSIFLYLVDGILYRLALNFLTSSRQQQVNAFLDTYPSFRQNILYLGLMYSRRTMPIKIISQITPDTFDDKIKVLEKIAGRYLPREIKEIIKELHRKDYIGISASVEIILDGTINTRVGLEIVFVEKVVEKLHDMIMGKDIGKLWDILLQYNLIDERYKKLQSVTVLKKNTIGTQELNFLSFLSHIKLSWDKDGMLPVKVYIGADFR